MTRKRTRENLVQMLCEPCGYCEGRGYMLSSESVAYKVLREIRKDLPRFCGRQIAVTVNPRVAEVLLGPARRARAELSEELGREIEIHTRPGLHQEQFEVVALDTGPPVSLSLTWLEESKPESEEADDLGAAAAEEAAAAEPEAPEAGAPKLVEPEAGEPVAELPEIPDPAAVAAAAMAEVGSVEEEDVASEPAPEGEEPEPRTPWVPGAAEALPPPGGDTPEEIATGVEHPGSAGERIALVAEPFAEMLDAEAESPILPDSDEREES
jgi:hypothetical protein